MASSAPKNKKRSLARPFVITVAAVGLPTAIAVESACGTDKPASGAPGHGNGLGNGTIDNGTCSNEGEQRACHVDLGKTANQYQTCFYGKQTCTGGLWSACGGEGTVTSSMPGVHVAPASNGGIPLNAKAFCGDGTCNGGETCNTCPNDCCPPPGAASPGATVCTTDPCDPGCLGWNQTSAPVIEAGTDAGVGVSGFGQIPGGQIKKELLDGCYAGQDCDNFGAYGVPSSYYNCQMDTWCSYTALGGDGCCHQFPLNGTQDLNPLGNGTNSGIDLTIGPGCADKQSDGYRYFPVCNRGLTAIAAGVTIHLKYFTPGFSTPNAPCQNNSCTATSGFDCSVTTPTVLGQPWPGNEAGFGSYAFTGLPPGQCILADLAAPGMAPGGANCTPPSATKFIYVNCDGSTNAATTEGPISWNQLPTPLNGAPDNEPDAGPGDLGCANNFTIHSQDNNPPSCTQAGATTITYMPQYQATCPAGYAPRWNKLYWNTSCPRNASGTSEITFEAATAPDNAGVPGVFGQFIVIGEAQSDTGIPGNSYTINGVAFGSDPQVCDNINPGPANTYIWNTCSNTSTIGPSPSCCPKDFLREFTKPITATPFFGDGPTQGTIDDQNPWLDLRITLRTTPDGKQTPKLNSWSLSYTCVGIE